MTLLHPDETAVKWSKRASMLERIHQCRAMLAIHGFLSDAENERVKARIVRWQREAYARGDKDK